MHLLVAPDDPPVGHKNSAQEIREQVDPVVWDILIPGKAKHVPPIEIEEKPGEKYPWQRHCPLKPEVLRQGKGWGWGPTAAYQIPRTWAHSALLVPFSNSPYPKASRRYGDTGLCKTYKRCMRQSSIPFTQWCQTCTPYLNARGCSILLSVRPQGCIFLYPPTSRLPVPFCL